MCKSCECRLACQEELICVCISASLLIQGILQSIEVLPTRQLPHMAANANAGFDTWQQIHFGNDVLTWMQQLTGLQAPLST